MVVLAVNTDAGAAQHACEIVAVHSTTSEYTSPGETPQDSVHVCDRPVSGLYTARCDQRRRWDTGNELVRAAGSKRRRKRGRTKERLPDVVRREGLCGGSTDATHSARLYHPDRAGADGEAIFIIVRNAFEALSDPVKRFAYDRLVQNDELCVLTVQDSGRT